MVRRIVGFTAATLCLAAALAAAAPCTPVATDTADPYRYLGALAEALGHAKTACDRLDAADAEGAAPSAARVAAIEAAKDDYECAAALVAAYPKSSSDDIARSAESASSALTQLAAAAIVDISHARRVLEGKRVNVAPEGSALAAARDRALGLLLSAAMGAPYCVIRQNPETRQMSQLLLTRTERDDVVAKLETAFGPEIALGLADGQPPLIAAAAYLYQVIVGPTYELAAE